MSSPIMKRLSSALAVFCIPIALCAFTIGLTHLPCYATVCPEDFLTYETRYHLGVFYLLLMLLSLALYLRSSSRFMLVLSRHRSHTEIPFFGKYFTVGGVTTALFITGFTLATTAIWLPSHWSYWGERTDPLGWDSPKVRLTVTGVTGHYADILLSLLIIPVSRNNLVGRAFGLHQSTLLFAHKMVAYAFFAMVLAHLVSYGTYALDPTSDGDEARNQAFGTGNPTLTLEESESRSSWYSKTTYTGVAVFLVLILIAITALPFFRRRYYNVFYYCHMISSVLIFVGASIHASTDFYLLLPGLCLWVVDWAWRFFSGPATGLHEMRSAKLENAGEGWYRLSFPQLVCQSGKYQRTSSDSEELGMSLFTPLQSYYLNIPSVSKIQNHAFTAGIPSSSLAGPVFLFQRAQGKAAKKMDKQWTWKLGALVPRTMDSTDIDVRLEGPYEPRDTGFELACDIVCIVGGTGITGAYSLVCWWLKMRATSPNTSFTLIWAIRHRELSNFKEWRDLERSALSVPNLRLVTHVSSEEGRLDPKEQIRRALCLGHPLSDDIPVPGSGDSERRRAWIYGSGPDSLVRSTERACVEMGREIRANQSKQSIQEIGWYMAKWEV